MSLGLLPIIAAMAMLAGDAAPTCDGLGARDDHPIVRIPPIFPEACRPNAASVETVRVRMTVGANGKIKNAKVVESSNACFNEATLENARRWIYRGNSLICDKSDRVVETTFVYKIED